MDKRTKERHHRYAQAFLKATNVHDLCRLLKSDKRRLQLLSRKPKYRSFSIPKKGGGERHIETSGPMLKRIQAELNRYLQSIYLFEKSSAAYGFITGVRNDDDRRNVVTNARKHLGRAHLMNIDLKDFFHSVRKKHVEAVFRGPPFNFKPELVKILTGLTVYKGRLPMGTPTSPVLSNFACRALDERLTDYCKGLDWVYTRYADDMTFSAHALMTYHQIEEVKEMIRKAQFRINDAKLRIYGPEDEKVVTGLLLTDKVELAPGYLQMVERDVEQLRIVLEVQNFQGQLSAKWVEQHKLQVRGRLNFAGFVLGRRDERYQKLKEAYYAAINPPEDDFGAVSWRSFPYNM